MGRQQLYLSLTFSPEWLQFQLLDEGTPPDYTNSRWGEPMIVNIPPQTVKDINWGGNHTISGKITAIRML